MRKLLVSFLVTFVVVGGAVVSATVLKLKAHPEFQVGSVGHTELSTSGSAYCAGCHSGTFVTGALTDSAGTPTTATQLYPGEAVSLRIRATVSNTYTAAGVYYLGANVAATGGTLTSTEPAIITTSGELQHHSTKVAPVQPTDLKAVPSGGSNFYTFSYTNTNTAITTTSKIAAVTCVDQPAGAGCQHAPHITVTSRRPADPTSVTPGTADSSSIVLNWLSSGPLNRVIVKTGTFATSPTDATGTVYDVSGSTATIGSLSPATTYFFKLWDLARFSPYDSYSANGVTTTAATTTAPLVAPTGLTVANITATGANLTWSGTSPEFRAIYKVGSVPTSPTDGTLIFEGATPFASVSGLTPNTRYFFAVYGKASGTALYTATAPTTSIITSPTAFIMPNGAGLGGTWDVRASPTRQGRFIYGTDSGDLNYFDGSVTTTIQPKGTLTGNPNTVFTLGTGSTPGQLIAAWRRGTDDAYVSVIGGSTFRINAVNPINAAVAMNAEVITIDSGYVFAVFRATVSGSEVRNAFLVDPLTGNATNLTGNTTTFGVGHMSSSGNKAVFSFDDGTGSLGVKVGYYNGTTFSTIDSGVNGDPSIAQGRIVYAKFTAPGQSEIFAYDTNVASPSPAALTNNPAYVNDHPFTDGRHAAWIRSNSNLSDPEVVLNGGIQVSSGNYASLMSGSFPIVLDRGQLLWRDTGNVLHYITSFSNDDTVDPATSATRTIPWLADGYVAFFDYNASSNADETYRFVGQPPNDTLQPSPPMTLTAMPGSNSVTLQWDAILGATSYNIYYASRSGVTKANYASLAGTKLSGITSNTHTISGLAANAAYYFVVTAVAASGEGPESRQASTVLVGTPAWVSVGSLGATSMSTVAADMSVPNIAFASGGNDTYISSDSGATWTPFGAGLFFANIRAIAANAGTLFATSPSGSIYRSKDTGATWTSVVSATSGQLQQAIAIDPAIPTTVLAGDFRLSSFTGGANDSDIIRSDDGGATWFHVPQFAPSGSLVAYALAFDRTHSSTLYLGGNGTPNVARSLAGGAGWSDVNPGTGSGYVYTVTVDPKNPQIIYAGTTQAFGALSPGAWKSANGGTNWTQMTGGLPASLAVHSILVDPADSNVLHLGTESGYYYSTNGGTSWTLANAGLVSLNAQFISALAMTGNHRLIAATNAGLYRFNLGISPALAVTSINPVSGNISGGTSVTLTGSNFDPGATVMFDTTAATNVSVLSPTTITATSPAHAAGAVNVTVDNPDGQSAPLLSGFTYSSLTAPVVTTVSSATQVTVNWTSVSGATSYQVYRRSAGTGFVPISAATTANTFPDSAVTTGSAYLYEVRASNGSSFIDSAPHLATAMSFTDDPLVAGSIAVKYQHLFELRNAASAVRTLAGQTAFSFSAASAGTAVTAAQINELRTALDGGLSPLGLPTGGYTDTLAADTLIRAVHWQEVRNRVK